VKKPCCRPPAGRLAGFGGRLAVAQAPIVVCNEEYRFVTAEQLRPSVAPSRDIVLEPMAATRRRR
jgi:mannose-1-phosphate guanylyltransferase/mannose-6-phosphate isomerase